MIGSDWPVCTLSGGYQAVMEIVERYLEQFSTEIRDKVLGETAAEYYGIRK